MGGCAASKPAAAPNRPVYGTEKDQRERIGVLFLHDLAQS